jgi:glycerol-3-phosphate dehydrogenase
MKTRAEELQSISWQQFDLCVIGGGATGSACALDAQLRGIRTVLLEAGDFAGATSSAATKIIHGGVRYLEEAVKGLDLQEYHVLVRALHERVRMLENAPHLTRPLEFLVPSYHWVDIAYLDIGLKIYDWLAGPGRISPSKFLSREETLERMPGLNADGLIGSVAYSDGQFDDARYNIALVETFTRVGGNALNHAKVADLMRDSNGRISGVVFEDQITKHTFTVKANVTVNATGPLADSIRQLASPTLEKRMRPSKGSHILFRLEVFTTEDALLIPKTEDGRVLFAVPWGGRLLVGTTDEEVSPDAELVVTKEDVESLLRHFNQYLANPVSPDEGEGFTDDYWKRLSREHTISEGTARHLAAKFGTASRRVLELGVEDPGLLHTLLPGGRAIRAEVVYVVRSEMATTIEDVLVRRLGMQFYSWSDCIEAAPIVGSLMPRELKWTKASTRDAVASYVQAIHRLMDSAGLSRKHALSSHSGESATD